jgi:hypothetical protein
MVAGNHDLRFRQKIEKGASFLELVRTSALRKITGYRDEIRIDLGYSFN